jgi:capsular exopolysaccharide synthesis family protein
MSRIQDILAKAERDGTAQRTQAGSAVAPAPAPAAFAPPAPVFTPPAPVAPLTDGSSALDTNPFRAAAVPPPAPAAAEGRMATATLHPTLVAAIDPHSEAAERYRTLRARISHREETMPLRTLMITGPNAAAGVSITAANLALTMAQEPQRRVVLVDGNLRDAAVHSLFGLDRGPGLAELLTGEASLDQVLVHLADHQLTVLPAGRTPQFPTELLGSTAMRRVIDTLRSRFDRVLLDMPSALPFADAGTVAPMADGVLMVVRAGVTHRPQLDQALATFDEDRVVGVVLNDAQ